VLYTCLTIDNADEIRGVNFVFNGKLFCQQLIVDDGKKFAGILLANISNIPAIHPHNAPASQLLPRVFPQVKH